MQLLMPRAERACASCRQQKRSCDKVLPSCTRCSRSSKTCDYSEAPAPSPSPEVLQLQQKIARLERDLSQRSSSSASASPAAAGSIVGIRLSSAGGSPPINDEEPIVPLFFLDSYAFRHTRREYPRAKVAIPRDVLVELGDQIHINHMLELYFSTVHTWLPVISQTRMRQRCMISVIESRAELALLILCMKLATRIPIFSAAHEFAHLHQLCRGFLELLECRNLVSVEILQAALLVAAFELGHALYPVAYLTITHTVSLSNMLGLYDAEISPQMLPPCNTATEIEERKRIRWAVLILERYANLGGAAWPMASLGPGLNDLLPNETSLWDQGKYAFNDSLAVASNPSAQVSAFARVCQVTHLLDGVKRHQKETVLETETQIVNALQLQRTVFALANVIRDKFEQDLVERGTTDLWCAMGLAYSTLLLLYEHHSHLGTTTNPFIGQDQVRVPAFEGMRTVTREVAGFARALRVYFQAPERLPGATILALEGLFSAGTNCVWYNGGSEDLEARAMLGEIVAALEVLKGRWGAGRAMLEVLEWEGRQIRLDSA